MAATTPIIIDRSSGGGITTGKVLGGAIIIVGTIYIGKQIKNYFEKVAASQQLKADQQSTIEPAKGKVLFDLNGKPIKSANIATIAADLENALSYPVDGNRVIRVFRTTPFGHVKELETFYLNKYGENLKDRIISRLSDSQWIAIKYNFR